MAFQSGKNLTGYELMGQLPELKKEYTWLNEPSAQSLQQAILNLERAYTNFYKKKSGFPVFKKKIHGGSFKIPIAVKVDFDNWMVELPKHGKVSFNRDRKFDGQVRQATVSKTQTGRYYISILVNTSDEPEVNKPIVDNTTVGIDLGIKTFAVLSDGIKVKNPRNTLVYEKQLRVAQRSFARKQWGSNRQKKQRFVISKINEKTSNRRKDFLHKLSAEITNQYDTICLETLNISGIAKNHKLAKHVYDAGWGEFIRQLEYKAKWKGKNIIKIGRWEPSSKMCSCGEINNELTLMDREWTCNICNVTHDRDLLAAQNIKKIGLRTQPDIRQRETLVCASDVEQNYREVTRMSGHDVNTLIN